MSANLWWCYNVSWSRIQGAVGKSEAPFMVNQYSDGLGKPTLTI